MAGWESLSNVPCLRGGDNDAAVGLGGLEVLREGNVLVGRPRRRVDEEKVQLAPVHVLEELLDEVWGGGMRRRKWLGFTGIRGPYHSTWGRAR